MQCSSRRCNGHPAPRKQPELQIPIPQIVLFCLKTMQSQLSCTLDGEARKMVSHSLLETPSPNSSSDLPNVPEKFVWTRVEKSFDKRILKAIVLVWRIICVFRCLQSTINCASLNYIGTVSLPEMSRQLSASAAASNPVERASFRRSGIVYGVAKSLWRLLSYRPGQTRLFQIPMMTF